MEKESAPPDRYCILAIYKFLGIQRNQNDELDLNKLKAELLQTLKSNEVKGTLLIAHEGINGTICMPEKNKGVIEAYFTNHNLWRGCRMRWSVHKESVFHRTFVKIKKEIVSMGIPLGDENDDTPTSNPDSSSGHSLAGTYLKATEWDKFLRDNPDVDLIDCRNSYEVKMGTFQGAIDPNTDTFHQFPEWLRRFGEEGNKENKPKKIAMFCTGGIRCEKSTAFAKSLKSKNGEKLFEEVYHLDGGILSYLDKVKTENKISEDVITDSTFEGECFVFDQRVSVREGLERGTYTLCNGCRAPLSKDNVRHPTFIRGVQCENCCDVCGDGGKARNGEGVDKNKLNAINKKKERQISRQRQFELAEAKGKAWGDACNEFAQLHKKSKAKDASMLQ